MSHLYIHCPRTNCCEVCPCSLHYLVLTVQCWNKEHRLPGVCSPPVCLWSGTRTWLFAAAGISVKESPVRGRERERVFAPRLPPRSVSGGRRRTAAVQIRPRAQLRWRPALSLWHTRTARSVGKYRLYPKARPVWYLHRETNRYQMCMCPFWHWFCWYSENW